MFRGQLAHRGPCPGVAAFIGLPAQAKLARLKSAGAFAIRIHTLPFGFNPGDATGTQGIGV